MAPTSTLSSLLTLLATASATSITFHNLSPDPVCYMAETSTGTFPSSNPCGLGKGLSLQPNQKITMPLDPTFNGALTAWTGNNNNDIRGARYEVNFAATPGSTWYDADYQLGMSDGTVGPLDNRKLTTGQSAVSGEPDTLAKANAAWPHTENKAELLAQPKYIRQGAGGELSFVYCDSEAPNAVVDFFQVTAEFDAYVDAGSVAGEQVPEGSVKAQAVKMANEKSLVVGTQEMMIVAY